MVRLHLVGFTTDLKNLIFATRRGAKRGGYVVAIDRKLAGTLLEIDRLEQEARVEERPSRGRPEPVRTSALSPKEIQTLLREGKSEEQVARLANTDVDWITRFVAPILAERDGVIRRVRAATISKPRLGPSQMPIEEAIQANLEAKKVSMDPDAFEDSWKAVRKGGRWDVSFNYSSRGKKRLARFRYDPEAHKVEPANPYAVELAWRGGVVKRRKASATSRNGKRPAPSRSRAAARKPAASRNGAAKTRARSSRSG